MSAFSLSTIALAMEALKKSNAKFCTGDDVKTVWRAFVHLDSVGRVALDKVLEDINMSILNRAKLFARIADYHKRTRSDSSCSEPDTDCDRRSGKRSMTDVAVPFTPAPPPLLSDVEDVRFLAAPPSANLLPSGPDVEISAAPLSANLLLAGSDVDISAAPLSANLLLAGSDVDISAIAPPADVPSGPDVKISAAPLSANLLLAGSDVEISAAAPPVDVVAGSDVEDDELYVLSPIHSLLSESSESESDVPSSLSSNSDDEGTPFAAGAHSDFGDSLPADPDDGSARLFTLAFSAGSDAGNVHSSGSHASSPTYSPDSPPRRRDSPPVSRSPDYSPSAITPLDHGTVSTFATGSDDPNEDPVEAEAVTTEMCIEISTLSGEVSESALRTLLAAATGKNDVSADIALHALTHFLPVKANANTFVRVGGIPALVCVISRFPLRVCQALYGLLSFRAHDVEVVSGSVVEGALAAMATNLESADVQEAAVGVLSRLSGNGAFSRRFFEAGCVPRLFATGNAHVKNAGVLKSVFKVIDDLSRHIVDVKDVSRIVDLVLVAASPASDANIISCLKTLACSQSDLTVLVPCLEFVLDSLTRALEAPPFRGKAGFLDQGCVFLHRLSGCCWTANPSTMLVQAQRAREVLLRVLSSSHVNKSIEVNAKPAFEALSDYIGRSVSSLTSDTLLKLLSVLQRFMDVPSLVDRCFSMLLSAAPGDLAHNQEGIDVICAAMEREPNNSFRLQTGCQVLSKIPVRATFKCRVATVVLSAMVMFPDDHLLLEAAYKFLLQVGVEDFYEPFLKVAVGISSPHDQNIRIQPNRLHLILCCLHGGSAPLELFMKMDGLSALSAVCNLSCVQIYLYKILSLLASDPDNHVLLVQKACLGWLSPVLNRRDLSLSTRFNGLEFVCHMATGRDGRLDIMNRRLHVEVIRAISVSAEMAICYQCCKILAALTVDDLTAAAIVDAGGEDAVCGVLKKYKGYTEIDSVGCDFLIKLAANRGCFQSLAAVLLAHSTCCIIQEKGFEALTRMVSTESTLNSSFYRFVVDDGMANILSAMRAFPDSSRLQKCGCLVISAVISIYPYLVSKEYVTVVQQSIQAHAASSDVLQAGLIALKDLATTAMGFFSCGGLVMTADILRNASSSAVIIEDCCSIVSSLLMYSLEPLSVESVTVLLDVSVQSHVPVQYAFNFMEAVVRTPEGFALAVENGAIQTLLVSLDQYAKSALVMAAAHTFFRSITRSQQSVLISRLATERLFMVLAADPGGNLWAWDILLSFVTESMESRVVVADQGGVESAVSVMRLCPEAVDTQERGCNFLFNILLLIRSRKRLEEVGAFDLLGDITTRHVNNAIICESACGIIRRVALCRISLKSMAEGCTIGKAAATVVRCMQTHLLIAEVQIAGCGALRALFSTTESRLLPEAASSAPCLLASASANPTSSLVSYGVWNAIWGMSFHSPAVKLALLQAGGAKALLKAMDMHLDRNRSEVLCVYGAARNLVMCPQFKRAFVMEGGLYHFYTAMNRFVEDEEIVKDCFASLQSAVFGCPENQVEFVRSGGLEAVYAVMQRYSPNESIQSTACSIFRIVCTSPTNRLLFIRSNGVPKVLQALVDFPDAADMHIHICWTIAEVSKCEDGKSAVQAVNGVSTIRRFASKHKSASAAVTAATINFSC